MTKRNTFRRSHAAAAAAILALSAAAPVCAQGISLETARQDAAGTEAAEVAEPPAGNAIPEGSVGGMGDINLYPRRIVMDQRQRIASIGIYNKTPYEGDYEISVADMMMTPDGRVIPLDNLPAGVDPANVKTASDMLRWSPRRVMLPGSESQTVRVMARAPADLPDGEYRAHFMVVSVPREDDQGFSIEDAVNDGVADGESVGVTIRPRFGISIPVIMRVGATTLQVGLENVGLVQEDDGTFLVATITRSGTRSAYGDMLVTAPGVDEPVVLAKGIGVYPEIDARQIRLALNPQFDAALLRSGMVLTATFIDDDAAPGETLARREFTVP